MGNKSWSEILKTYFFPLSTGGLWKVYIEVNNNKKIPCLCLPDCSLSLLRQHKVAEHGLLASAWALPLHVWPSLSYLSSLDFSFFNSKMNMMIRMVMMMIMIVVKSNWTIWGGNELTHVKCFAQFLEVSKLHVRVWYYYCHYQNRRVGDSLVSIVFKLNISSVP